MGRVDGLRPGGHGPGRGQLGWGSHLEFTGSTLYVAAGNFGVFQKSLDVLTTLAP